MMAAAIRTRARLGAIKRALASQLGPLQWSRSSFSQEGEDLALDKLLSGQRTGLYVDVGCHHPFRFSNTYFFYRMGWSGVCIDPLPGTKRLFRRWRRRDVVVEAGVARGPGQLTYHMFDEPAVNTFDEALARERLATTPYKMVSTIHVPTNTLTYFLEQHCAPGRPIDFMSVDVEGFDLEVLESNDWDRFRPRILVVECLKSELAKLSNEPTTQFLAQRGYAPYAKTGNSVLFVESTR
jgi:FkbM family methyltransferase